MYTTCNHGKEIRTIDLKTAEGVTDLLELIDGADIVVQNFRPGTMERMGLGWEMLHARCPELICVSISGFGTEGPMSGFRVYDPIIQAAAGICDSQADPVTGDLLLFQGILADKATSLYAGQAALAALLDRAQQRPATGTSVGTHVELNMFDCGLHFNWPDGMYNETFVESDGVVTWPDYAAFYRLTAAAGGHLAYSIVSDQEVTGALRAVGLEQLLDDPRFANAKGRATNRDELLPLVDAAVTDFADMDELLAALWANDVPASKVEDRSQLHSHPQAVANGSIRVVEDVTSGRIRQSSPVFEI